MYQLHAEDFYRAKNQKSFYVDELLLRSVLSCLPSPYITVIVTAHDRRKYLQGAVTSTLDQSLPNSLYEVIVVKDFSNVEIDSWLNKKGILNLYSNSQGIGGKIYEALQYARGEVISFLEDDDEFLHQKLETVFHAFKNGCDYYHNEQVIITDSGLIKNKTSRPSYWLHSDQLARYLYFMGKIGAHNNSSSIAIRASILKDQESLIRNIRLSTDIFYFIASLMHGRLFFLDGSALTLFRVHPGQSNINIQDLESFIERKARATEIHLNDMDIMLSIVKGTPYESYFRYILKDLQVNCVIYNCGRRVTWSYRDLKYYFHLPSSGFLNLIQTFYKLFILMLPIARRAQSLHLYYSLTRKYLNK